ncbi:MAG: methyltransferase type 11 [Myxococcales bacterium]|nr:methyltransferase type 11 [Myxococcales bacterium]
MTLGPGDSAAAPDPDELLCMRLRDLGLVDLDAFVAGLDGSRAAELVGAYADDVALALREARTRIAALRAAFGGPDPLNVVDTTPRQRASDTATAGAERVRIRLTGQAEAARALARLAEMAGSLVPKLFEADRRR